VFEHFTPPARHAVSLGDLDARVLGSPYIGTGHLLLGLLRCEGSIATATLRDVGVTWATLVDDLRTPRRPGHRRDAPIPFDHGAKASIATAVATARRLRHVRVGTEHLLLGLLHVPDEVATTLLTGRGVDPADVCAVVLTAIADGSLDADDGPTPRRHGRRGSADDTDAVTVERELSGGHHHVRRHRLRRAGELLGVRPR
jgi:ATP-dependent Clp protease ATP-binding subunit ClpC